MTPLLGRLAGSALACIALMSVMPVAAAMEHQPFGFRKGMSMAELRDRIKLTPTGLPFMYQAMVPPTPNPAFGLYLLTVLPKQGLCGFVALGVGVPTTPDGAGARRHFDQLKRDLSAQYGPPTGGEDGLKVGKQPDVNSFMEEIVQNERVLTARWQREQGAALPVELDLVALLTGAVRPDVANIGVLHHFSNYAECEREQATARKTKPKP